MNSDGLVRRECANNAFAADHDRDHIALDMSLHGHYREPLGRE